MRTASCTSRVLAGLICLVSAVACSDVTHTVGTVDMKSQLREGDAADDAPADNSTPTSSTSTGSAGNASMPPQSGGTITVADPAPSVSDPLPPLAAPAIQVTNPDGCVWDAHVAMNRRLDMYLMVDSNITLPFVGGWDNLVSGLSIYADHPRAAGTGVGVRFFGIECSPETYAMPDVIVDLLPDNAREIRRSFPLPFNFSPMLPALEGAIIHARSRAFAHPDWKQVVVFVTDGFSTDLSCLTTPESLLDIAREGYQGLPSIPTYVVALASPAIAPNPFDPTDRVGPLEQVAVAGGTGLAREVDLQGEANDIVEALLSIQREAEPCEYAISAEVAQAAGDPGSVALAMWNSTEPLPRVARRGECGDGPGYYLDDVVDPHYLLACAATCATIRADGNRPTLLAGCEAPER